MKATINSQGRLMLMPESGMEDYALQNWVASQRDFVIYAYVESADHPDPRIAGSMCREEQTQ